MKTPRISLCLPTYNRQEYLPIAIDSALRQTFEDFELIVVDNASTDATSDILHSIKDPRIRIYRNPETIDLYANHRKSLEYARAPYVCFLHDDDRMYPNNLATKIKVLDENSDVAFAHSSANQIDAQGKIFAPYWAADHNQDFIMDGQTYLRRLLYGCTICLTSALVRKPYFEKLCSFSHLLSDWEFFLRVCLHGNVGFIREPLVEYRKHATNSWLDYGSPPAKNTFLQMKLKFLRDFENEIPNVNALRADVVVQTIEETFEYLQSPRKTVRGCLQAPPILAHLFLHAIGLEMRNILSKRNFLPGGNLLRDLTPLFSN